MKILKIIKIKFKSKNKNNFTYILKIKWNFILFFIFSNNVEILYYNL